MTLLVVSDDAGFAACRWLLFGLAESATPSLKLKDLRKLAEFTQPQTMEHATAMTVARRMKWFFKLSPVGEFGQV